MPSTSEKQRRLMGMALAYKRGETSDASDTVKRISKSMSEKELKKFASKNESVVVEATMSTSEMDQIRNIVKTSKSLMSAGDPLRQAGFKVEFHSSEHPIPPHMEITSKKNGARFILINKKYAVDADWYEGDIAGGIAESKFFKKSILKLENVKKVKSLIKEFYEVAK